MMVLTPKAQLSTVRSIRSMRFAAQPSKSVSFETENVGGVEKGNSLHFTS